MTLAEKVLSIIKKTIDSKEDFVSLHEPGFFGNEWEYVKKCLDSTFVSSVGQYVDRFEEMLAEYTGVKSVIAVVNGTSALHIALMLAGVERGDEVLTPALSFVAGSNAVMYCGAIPHFVDSEERTLGLDPHKLADYLVDIAEIRGDGCYNKTTGRRIRAVVPVHTFGHPVDLEPLVEVSQRFKIQMVEDAAESLGTLYKGQHTGNWGRLSVLSFNGNKIITTGGGGAILTNDEKMGKLAKHITTTAKLPHRWEFFHDQLGYNYRMPNINAALGCAQLEKLPSFVESKRNLAKRYSEAFAVLGGVTFVAEPLFARSNYWLNAILVTDGIRTRDFILELTNSCGVMTRPAWVLMHKLPMYADCPKMDLPVAESLEARLISIPSSSGL